MLSPRALILRAPGTNCDHETAHAFERAGGLARRVHVRALAERPAIADDCQILCIPGGFSYGDDIASGRIFALELKTRLGDALVKFRDKGGLVLGICNGFQVLLQTGLLLADPTTGMPEAALAHKSAALAWDALAQRELAAATAALVRLPGKAPPLALGPPAHPPPKALQDLDAGGPAPWRQAEGAQPRRAQCLDACLFSCMHTPVTCWAGGHFCPGQCVVVQCFRV